MNPDQTEVIKSLVECVKLQQQLIGQFFQFLDGQKADRNPIEQDRREAMFMRGESARNKMQTTTDAINKKIDTLEKKLESL